MNPFIPPLGTPCQCSSTLVRRTIAVKVVDQAEVNWLHTIGLLYTEAQKRAVEHSAIANDDQLSQFSHRARQRTRQKVRIEKLSLKTPPHINLIATLPCEIFGAF